MERLSNHILEFRARRTVNKEFPWHPDEENIIEFLELNGFKRVSSLGRTISGKIYELGLFDPKMPQTFWVKFMDTSDPKRNLFFCRLRNFGIKGFSDFISFGKSVPFDEFRKDVCEFFGWD